MTKSLKSTDEGETRDISFEAPFWLAILTCYLTSVLFVIFGFCLLFG